MNRKTKDNIAGIIFIALSVHEVYGLLNAIFTLRFIGYSARLIGSMLLGSLLPSLCCMAALIALTVSVFRHTINQKTKTVYTVLYLAGRLFPFLMGIGNIVGMVASAGFWIAIAKLALFLFAVIKLLQTGAENTAAAATAADRDQLTSYQDLLRQGVISPEEFEAMRDKIGKGQR